MSRGPDKQFDVDETLDKAMEVFWERGFEGSSLSNLLRQMRIGKKSLYDTFGNKRALFCKALDRYGKTAINGIEDHLAQPGSPLKNLQELLVEVQRQNEKPNSNGCMLGTNIADFNTCDPEMAAMMRRFLKRVETAFYRALQRAQKLGEISPDTNIPDTARMLVCFIQGLSLIGRVSDDKSFFKGAVAATLNSLK